MTEPLMRRLATRGERLTVAAMSSIAPVYRAMPSVFEVLELPFQHGGLQLFERWKLARSLRGRFDKPMCAPTHSRAR